MLTSGTFATTGRTLRTVTCCLCAVVLLLQLAATESAKAGSGSWPWPLLGEVVTQYKNGSDPYAAGQHRGVDIAAPAGTPARAIVAGKVTYSGRLPDGGETITVRSAGSDHLVSYLHLQARLMKRGATVSVGESLGRVGVTGRRSVQQPHLHLSVRVASTKRYVDPLALLGPPSVVEHPVASPTQTKADAPTEIKSLERPASTIQPRVAPIEVRRPQEQARAPKRIEAIEPAAAKDSARKAAHDSHGSDRSKSAAEKAPPPLSSATERTLEPATGERAVDRRSSRAQPAPQAAMPANPDRPPPFRTALIALATIALLALLVNRKPPRRDARPTAPAPIEAGAADGSAQVLDFQNAKIAETKAAHGDI